MFSWFSRKRPKLSEAAQFVEFGVQARLEGDWESAKVSAETALKTEPDNADAHYLLGLIALSRGDSARALSHFDSAIVSAPEQPRAHFSRGEALAAQGDLVKALTSFEHAVRLNDGEAAWWRSYGQALIGLGRYTEAAGVFRQAMRVLPDDAVLAWMLGEALWREGLVEEGGAAFRDAWVQACQPPALGFGLAAYLLGRPDPDRVEQMCRSAETVLPQHPELLATRALCLAQTNRLPEALALAESVVQSHPASVLAWTHLGIVLRVAGRLDDAVRAHERAAELGPDDVETLVQCATTFIQATRFEAAEALLNHAVTIAPDNGEVLYRLACVLKARRALDEAELLFRRAHKVSGGHAHALLDLSDLLVNLGRHKEAAEALFAMLALNPGSAEANVNLGVALLGLRHWELGLERLRKACEIDPRNVAARINLSNFLYSHGQPTQAEKEARIGLEVEPRNLKLLLCLSNALQSQGRFAESVDLYRQILSVEPGWEGPWSNLLLGLNYLADITPEALLEEHRRFGRQFTPRPPRARSALDRDRTPGRRLRIGYVSPDFRNHVVGMFVEPVLRLHDRNRFEIYCYFTHTEADTHTPRFRQLAEIWRDIGGLSDDEAERLMLEDTLDIVVDLAGHTGGNRLALLARRLAPVQVTWLGYPNGTGLEAMDWRITDNQADPAPAADGHYVERLMRVREPFIAYEPPSRAPQVQTLPFDAAGVITFGAFNNYQKVTDEALRCWKEILDRVPGSRLVTKSLAMGDPVLQSEVKRRFERLGFDLSRVLLQGPVKDPIAHFETIGGVDIALDTFPYNGTTTTCELLWMGVPVVTLAGDRHASRVGLSLLHAVGLAEHVGTDASDYVARAVALAHDPDALRHLRLTLRDRIGASPLADVSGLVKALEQAYGAMWDQWRAA